MAERNTINDSQATICTGLPQVELKPEYNTEDDDIIRELYCPCLRVSERYDRAVGYFRANIYRELGEDLLNFVIAGGKVRIVCSPDMPKQDEEAAREGYALRGVRPRQEREATLIHVLEAMSKNPKESDCLDMLRLMIERGSLDLYIAMRVGGIYHRKIGVLYDSYGNIVSFSGSGNETQMAVSSIEDWGNDEEFDVYRSWGDEFESSKAFKKAEYLQKLFNEGTKRTRVRPLNHVEREFLAQFRSHSNFEDCRPGARMRSSDQDSVDSSRTAYSPYHYQRQAIEAWEAADRVGMLSMATSTGKTLTALFAISHLVQEGRPVLVLVPSKILMSQWHEEIRKLYPDIPILLAGGGHNWKLDRGKRMYISKTRLPRIILATMATAARNDFLQFFQQAEYPTLIADEAHRLGSPTYRRILTLGFKERLGLSATPERLFDSEGDEVLAKAFGERPVFDLPLGGKVQLSEGDQKEVPILGTFLSRYNYHFEVVHLNQQEQQDWDELTSEIGRTIARNHSQIEEDSLRHHKYERLQHLLIERARILKRAQGKIDCACRVISERYPSNGRWIIYCEDVGQMISVAEAIRDQNRHLIVLTYHSKMTPQERDRTLSYFEQQPSIIVSIRCLDEGVDIPEVDGALILASSKNPREYIQRRGRVLRKAIGKRNATIIDAIVLPDVGSKDEAKVLPIVRGELARAWNFAKLAENQEITHNLWHIATEYGVDIDSDAQLAFQDEDQEE